MSEYFRREIKKQHYPVHFSAIKFKTDFRNCVYAALKNRQWKETEEEDWDLLWCEKYLIFDVFDGKHLKATQRVNHFRFYTELCRKDLLTKNMRKYRRALEKEGKLEEAASVNFMPQTFHMPSEYTLFVEEFKKSAPVNADPIVWIMKPIAKCQGKGIFLFTNLKDIQAWRPKRMKQQTKVVKKDEQQKQEQCQPYIVQRYINNPLLFGRKKFDMRIYVLVTSYNPLIVYFYRSGFARFTHEPYNGSFETDNLFSHLTNVQIQKGSDNYDQKLGGKWLLDKLKLFLISRYGVAKVNEAFTAIQNIVLKSLFAVQRLIMHDKHCFELYGYDIMFDSNLKPWLLQVNGGPSMTANTQFDFDLKCGLLDDVLTIVDVEKVLQKTQQQVGGFDLIYKNGPVVMPPSATFTSMLGCQNNRKRQLRKLAKQSGKFLSQSKATANGSTAAIS